MKKVDTTKMLFGVLLILTLALPGVAMAAPTTIAEVENQGDTLVFYPFVQFKELLLTVTGPCGFEYKQRVEEGEQPFFRLDATTIDGVYTYDLVRIEEVDPDIVKVLLEARQNFDEETPKQLCRDGKLPAAPLDQSEGFRVFRGQIVYDPGAVEKAAGSDRDVELDAATLASIKPAPAGMSRVPTKDFVIIDDLIVDGSACIGFDCVNGESFGFDTIRIKENNLRIKFDDTSTAASFPRNDWQLTANDSANGGASKFSIDDISGSRTPFTVEANARSHSLYVDDGGRIGSRTSTPSVEIHTIDGDTPTLRLQQDGSSGFAPQTWDVAGNETNFFIRDVTNGSQLPFRIRPDAPTNSIFIDVDGDVGLGTASPDSSFDIESGSDPEFRLTDTDDGAWVFETNTNAANVAITKVGTGVKEFELDSSGNLTILGVMTTGGMTCGGGCDRVFHPDYEVESIEEHAEMMWKNSHLPAVGPTLEGTPVNLTEKTGGMLNELEKAHIYIEQLNDTIKQLQQRLEALESEQAE